MTDFTEHRHPEENRLLLLSQDQQRLRRQFNWLLGFLLGMLILIGVLSAIAIRLALDKEQLEAQVGTLAAEDKADSEQARTLDSQVNELNQQVNLLRQRVPQGLPKQLKTDQAQVQQLQSRIAELNTKVTNLEQVSAALQTTLKEQNAPDASPAPAPEP